ncbi:MAG: PrsW family glutamic-type intramembrane protease, partial [Verrucomicrobia bacterium]|nr:PrsW family glutamic-type intramembrane protease [Verrucomicrobiota bacterium]
MHGINIAALLTSLLAIVGFGTLIRKLDKPATGWLLFASVLICLPLQPLAFYFVRLPLDHWLVGQLNRTTTAYQWLVTLYAPLTEEPAKLLVLLIPAILRDVRPENFARYAFAIGLGFALGEMWFVAERVSHQPALAKLPFYQFGGYISERLMTCVFHSAFVAITLSRLRRRWVLGFGGAVLAHWAANFPLTLMAWNVGGLGRNTWEVIVVLWLVALFVGAVAWFAYLIFGKVLPLRLMYGIRH